MWQRRGDIKSMKDRTRRFNGDPDERDVIKVPSPEDALDKNLLFMSEEDIWRHNTTMVKFYAWPYPQKVDKQPFKCPVCEGKGFVPHEFYGELVSSDASPQICRSCNGRGVIWQ